MELDGLTWEYGGTTAAWAGVVVLAMGENGGGLWKGDEGIMANFDRAACACLPVACATITVLSVFLPNPIPKYPDFYELGRAVVMFCNGFWGWLWMVREAGKGGGEVRWLETEVKGRKGDRKAEEYVEAHRRVPGEVREGLWKEGLRRCTIWSKGRELRMRLVVEEGRELRTGEGTAYRDNEVVGRWEERMDGIHGGWKEGGGRGMEGKGWEVVCESDQWIEGWGG